MYQRCPNIFKPSSYHHKFTLNMHTPYQKLLCNQRWAEANTAQLSSQTCGTVTQRNHKIFTTDLWYRTCTCGHFQSNGIPCGHAFTLVYELQKTTLEQLSPNCRPSCKGPKSMSVTIRSLRAFSFQQWIFSTWWMRLGAPHRIRSANMRKSTEIARHW